MTLSELIDQLGSREAAARKLGLSVYTIHKWMQGKAEPSRLARERLKGHGVTWEDR